MTMGMLITFTPQLINATPVTSALVVPSSEESARAKTLVLRLNEIKAMDKSKMTSSEKKMLRVEVRSIQREYRHYGGVYISVGTVLLIVLIVILLA